MAQTLDGTRNKRSKQNPYNSFPCTHNETIIYGLKDALELNKDPAVASTLQKCLEKAIALEDYLETMCPEETPLQKRIRDDTMKESLAAEYKEVSGEDLDAVMINSNSGAQFEKLILEIGKCSRILEVGMFTGYTAALFCSIPSVRQVTTLELDPFFVNFAKSHFAGVEEEKKLRIIEGPALKSLETLKEEGETFDAVFIDADKPNYINYYKFIMDNNLIGSGGVFIVDNTLWKGQMYPTPHGNLGQVFAEFNNFVAKDERVTQVIIQLSDGVSIIRRK